MQSTPTGVHTLTIAEAFPEDEGKYKCIAVNAAGEAPTTAQLKVICKKLKNNLIIE